MPAYVELEEVFYTEDMTRTYGGSIKIDATQSAFALAPYLANYLMKARRLNRKK